MEKDVYNGQYVRLTEEVINGDLYERVHVRGASIVFARDTDGKFIFIKERRPHENPPVRIKPVTGFIDDGFDWRETADKELMEEAGKKANRLELIHHIPHKGTVNVDKFFVYATDLEDCKIANPDGEDAVLETVKFTMEEMLEKTLSNEIPIFFDSIGIFLLFHYVKNGKIKL